MNENEIKIAERFNILDKCQKLEKDFLRLSRITKVEFDLNGLYENIYQVIILHFPRHFNVEYLNFLPGKLRLFGYSDVFQAEFLRQHFGAAAVLPRHLRGFAPADGKRHGAARRDAVQQFPRLLQHDTRAH